MRTVTVIVNIFFLSFISTNSWASFTNFGLISEVHKYFRTSCVFVVHNMQENLDEYYRIEKLMRQFSANSVLAVALEFRRLKEAMAYYSKRIVRSLIVVNLRNREIVAKFSNLTSYFDMQSVCWLLIFDEKVYLETNPTKSGKNMFNIAFDTEMFVMRNNHSMIQDWYWLNNRVATENLALWDIDTGFKLITIDSLYERRITLEDSPIVVTAVNNPPMISFANGTVGGLFGNIFTELSRVINFTVEFNLPDELTYGSWDSDKQKWTGMIDMLVNKKASVAVADFTITTSRLEFVDFSLPLISTYDKLYIKKPENGIRWSAYWEALSMKIWIGIEALILFTTMILTMITAARRCKVTLHLISGYLLLVFGAYCQQGLPEFPTDSPSRIAYFSIFLSALIVSAAYAAALISFLTVTTTILPFTTLEEFVDDGTYKLIVYREGAEYDMFMNSKDPILGKMAKMIEDRDSLPVTLEEGFLQVCNGKVAFYVAAALEQAIRVSIPCKVVGVGTQRTMSLALALSKGSSYNGLINYHVQKFRDHGLLYRLKHEFMMGHNPPASTHTEVTLWGVLPLLAVLGGGAILAIFILYLERICFSKQSRELIREKKRRKLGPNKREEISKIRLRNWRKHPTPSLEFYL